MIRSHHVGLSGNIGLGYSASYSEVKVQYRLLASTSTSRYRYIIQMAVWGEDRRRRRREDWYDMFEFEPSSCLFHQMANFCNMTFSL